MGTISRLLAAQIVKHPPKPALGHAPRHTGNSLEVYTRLGMKDLQMSYVAFWLSLGHTSITALCEVVDRERLDLCLTEDCLKRRLKLLLIPVKAKFPFPSKGPSDAETVGNFFGQSASYTRSQMGSGFDIVSLQIDLYSKWHLRMALKKV